jgi:hypothetical protein
MDHPTAKHIGQMTVTVDSAGWPYWTRLVTHEGTITLDHEEARDLHYAMQRIVAFLDGKEQKIPHGI